MARIRPHATAPAAGGHREKDNLAQLTGGLSDLGGLSPLTSVQAKSLDLLRMAARAAIQTEQRGCSGRFIKRAHEALYSSFAWRICRSLRAVVVVATVVYFIGRFVAETVAFGWQHDNDITALHILSMLATLGLMTSLSEATANRTRWSVLVFIVLVSRIALTAVAASKSFCESFSTSAERAASSTCIAVSAGNVPMVLTADAALIPLLGMLLTPGSLLTTPCISVSSLFVVAIWIASCPYLVEDAMWSLLAIVVIFGSMASGVAWMADRQLRGHFVHFTLLDKQLLKAREIIGQRDAAVNDASRVRRTMAVEGRRRAQMMLEHSEVASTLQFVAAEMGRSLEASSTVVAGLVENSKCPPWVASGLSATENEISYMQQMIQDINDLARIRRGDMKLVPADLSLREMAEACINQLQGTCPFEIRLTVTPAVPATVRLDETRVRQILSTALRRACAVSRVVDEAADADLCIEVKISMPAEIPWQFLVEVSDLGPGLREESEVDALFDGPGAPSRRKNGFVLGLSVAKHLVGLMKGEIGIHERSNLRGRGACVWFRLPTAHEQLATDYKEASANTEGNLAAELQSQMRSSTASGVNLPIRIPDQPDAAPPSAGDWSLTRVSSVEDSKATAGQGTARQRARGGGAGGAAASSPLVPKRTASARISETGTGRAVTDGSTIVLRGNAHGKVMSGQATTSNMGPDGFHLGGVRGLIGQRSVPQGGEEKAGGDAEASMPTVIFPLSADQDSLRHSGSLGLYGLQSGMHGASGSSFGDGSAGGGDRAGELATGGAGGSSSARAVPESPVVHPVGRVVSYASDAAGESKGGPPPAAAPVSVSVVPQEPDSAASSKTLSDQSGAKAGESPAGPTQLEDGDISPLSHPDAEDSVEEVLLVPDE